MLFWVVLFLVLIRHLFWRIGVKGPSIRPFRTRRWVGHVGLGLGGFVSIRTHRGACGRRGRQTGYEPVATVERGRNEAKQ